MNVSIILPVYNGEKYLDMCMERLLKQTLTNYEIICVDDGSTDTSGEILDYYQQQHVDKIKVFHIENSGVWKARAFGISKAQGRYIGFCDCDDLPELEMYQTLYNCAVSEQAEMAVCSYKRVDMDTGKILACEMRMLGNTVITIAEHCDILPVINVSLWNKLIRRDIALKHIELEEPPRIAEDMMFLLSLYPFVTKISFCDTSLYNYMVRENSAVSYIKSKDIEIMKTAMLQTKQYVEMQTGDKWKEVIDAFVLIHFGVFVVLKSAGGRYKETIEIEKQMCEWMDNQFPDWNRNPYFTVRFVIGGHRYLAKPMFVSWMYCLKLFPLFLRLYTWITKTLKIDIKW